MPVPPNVAEQFKQHIVPIDSVQPWPGNPRQGDLDDIASSLQQYGQWRVAVVQKSSGNICIGNNMWHAAKEKLEWDGIAAIHLDVSDDDARRMLARDNRSSDKGTYNDYLLADFLGELADTDLGLDGTGYEPTDLDDLIKTTGAMAADTTSFLDTFTDAAATPAPVAHPFSDTPAPQQQPQQAATPTQGDTPAPAPAGDTSALAAAVPAQAAPTDANPVHTGPAVYNGPGADAPAGNGAALPEAPPLVNVQWVVTVEQRDTLRAAIKRAQTAHGLDNASAAVTAVAQHFLDTTEPAEAPA